MGFKDEMEQHDDQFQQAANEPRRGGDTLPDGRHQVQIVEMRMEIDSEDGTYTIITKYQNQAGSIRKWYNLDHEVARDILAQDAKMMGYEGKLSDIEDWLIAEEPIGLICEIGVKTKPGTERDFTNVYLNRVMGKQALQDFTDPAAGALHADDDIPF